MQRNNSKMIMGFNTKAIMSLVLSLLLFFALILSSFTLTYSWFVHNKDVDANPGGFNIEADRGASIHEYHIYKYDGQQKIGVEVSNSIVDDPLYDVAVSMTEYDTIFLDRNVDTDLIIKLVLDNVPTGNLTLEATVKCSDNYLDNENKLAAYLSNICALQMVGGNSTLDGYEYAGDIYSGAVAATAEAEKFSFVTATLNDDEYTTEKVYSLTFSVDNLSAVDGMMCVYIKISYNAELVNVYMQDHEITITGGSLYGDMKDFINDLSSISFGYV